MNPLSTVSAILTRPARTAGAVAVAGLRTTSRVVGWAVEQAASASRPESSSRATDTVTVPEPGPVAVVPEPATAVAPAPEVTAGTGEVAKKAAAKKAPAPSAPAKKAPAQSAPAKKAPTKKSSAKKAPSKQAAVLAPALGLSEAEVTETLKETTGSAAHEGAGGTSGDEPLIDPATAKAVATETETLRRASDPDKG